VRVRFRTRERARLVPRRAATPPLDPAIYGRAFLLLGKNPAICLAPLLAYVAQILIFKVAPVSGGGGGVFGGAATSLVGYLAEIVGWFGVAVAVIVGSHAWRSARGRASFDRAWDEARARVGDIFWAAIGFEFVISIAGIVGSFATAIGAIVLTAVAYFFFIYTIPAAVIGGTPGGAALNASLETAKRAPLPTLGVTVLWFVAFLFVPSWVIQLLSPVLLGSTIFASAIVSSLFVALIKALVAGYVALVLARTFEDVSYGRRWG